MAAGGVDDADDHEDKGEDRDKESDENKGCYPTHQPRDEQHQLLVGVKHGKGAFLAAFAQHRDKENNRNDISHDREYFMLLRIACRHRCRGRRLVHWFIHKKFPRYLAVADMAVIIS